MNRHLHIRALIILVTCLMTTTAHSYNYWEKNTIQAPRSGAYVDAHAVDVHFTGPDQNSLFSNKDINFWYIQLYDFERSAWNGLSVHEPNIQTEPDCNFAMETYDEFVGAVDFDPDNTPTKKHFTAFTSAFNRQQFRVFHRYTDNTRLFTTHGFSIHNTCPEQSCSPRDDYRTCNKVDTLNLITTCGDEGQRQCLTQSTRWFLDANAGGCYNGTAPNHLGRCERRNDLVDADFSITRTMTENTCLDHIDGYVAGLAIEYSNDGRSDNDWLFLSAYGPYPIVIKDLRRHSMRNNQHITRLRQAQLGRDIRSTSIPSTCYRRSTEIHVGDVEYVNGKILIPVYDDTKTGYICPGLIVKYDWDGVSMRFDGVIHTERYKPGWVTHHPLDDHLYIGGNNIHGDNTLRAMIWQKTGSSTQPSYYLVDIKDTDNSKVNTLNWHQGADFGPTGKLYIAGMREESVSISPRLFDFRVFDNNNEETTKCSHQHGCRGWKTAGLTDFRIIEEPGTWPTYADETQGLDITRLPPGVSADNFWGDMHMNFSEFEPCSIAINPMGFKSWNVPDHKL